MPGSSLSPPSAHGRLPEVTKGSFVEANHEEPALSIGQLWRAPKGGIGSAATVRRFRMRSLSWHLSQIGDRHPRTTALAVPDFLGGVGERQVPG